MIYALASANPGPYVPLLAEVIEQQGVAPGDWPAGWNRGGLIPAGDSWQILFDYVKSRPADELTAGKLDRSLDTLERINWNDSGQPCSLYALYLDRGLVSRAKEFRITARKRAPSLTTGCF